MRKFVFIGIIALVLAAAVTLFMPTHKNTPTTPSSASTTSNSTVKSRTSQDAKTDIAPAVRAAIVAQASNDPAWAEGDFTVSGTSEPVVGWLIATIIPSNPNSDTSRALLRRSGGSSLDLVAGPGTAFAKSILDQAGVPAAVQNQLVVFDDETPQ